MIELMYILYSLLAQLMFYQQERGWLSNNVLLFMIFTARFVIALIFRKKMETSGLVIAKLMGLGVLKWMEIHLFLKAFNLGNVSEIHAFLILRVPFEIMIDAQKSSFRSLIFAFAILIITLLTPLLGETIWGVYFNVGLMALNIAISKAFTQIAKIGSEIGFWEKEVYISLIALLISLFKGFKEIDFSLEPSIDSYLVGFGLIVLALVITTRKSSVEGTKFFSWASSLLVSCLGSILFGDYNSIVFILSTLVGHLIWFFYIYDSQRGDYDLLPVSAKNAGKTSGSEISWKKCIFLLFLEIMVFANDMGAFSGFNMLNGRIRQADLVDSVTAALEQGNPQSFVISDEETAKQNVGSVDRESGSFVISDEETAKHYDDRESGSFIDYSHWKSILSSPDQSKSSSCNALYGSGLIESYQGSKTNVCSSKDKHGTNIDCFYYQGRKGVSDVDFESLCEIQNFKLDLDKISKFKFPPNKKLEFWDMNYILKSTLGTCKLDTSLIKDKIHTEQPSAYLLNSYSNDDNLQCHEYFNKTILFISRWDTTNQYHATEDFLQAWVTLLVAGIDPHNAIVVRLDTKNMGPFTSFFNNALSGKPLPKEEKTDKNLTRDIINIVDWAKTSKFSCFSRAVFGIFAVPSPVSFQMYHEHPIPTSCGPPDTSIFTSFKDFMIKSFNFVPDSKLEPRKEVYLTYISRKGFLREIINEDYMLKKISETVCQSQKDCKLKIQVYDFQKLTFYQQISIARNSDILLGMHGAALTSSIYLPNSSTLIEIGHPSRSGNQHFQNIARFMGLKYQIFNGNDLLSDISILGISNAVNEEVIQRLRLSA